MNAIALPAAPTLKPAADKHDNEPAKHLGFNVPERFGHGMPPHGDAQQTKIEPHHHADGQSQREDVSAFNDRRNDTGLANGSTEAGVLDQLTPFKNRHPWRPFFR